MTLSRARKHRTQTSSSSGRENSAASENRAADPNGVEEAVEIHLRGCSQLPPVIPNEEDRPLIRPEGQTHWREIPRLGKERRPASVLTCLLKTYHPGIVQFRGKSVVATTWKHYKVDRDTYGRSKATDAEEGFWLRFRYESEHEYAARRHVGECCNQLLRGLKYYARIQAILDHFWAVEEVQICDKVAGLQYLSKAEYMAQQPSWCDDTTWNAMTDEWCHPDWKKKNLRRIEPIAASVDTNLTKEGPTLLLRFAKSCLKKKGEKYLQLRHGCVHIYVQMLRIVIR